MARARGRAVHRSPPLSRGDQRCEMAAHGGLIVKPPQILQAHLTWLLEGSRAVAAAWSGAASEAKVAPRKNRWAHEANSVCGLIPIITPRNSSDTSLILCPHWNIATYCERHHLLNPRNGLRKF